MQLYFTMKTSFLLICMMSFFSNLERARADGDLQELKLEYRFLEDSGIYKLWSVGSEIFINYINPDEKPVSEKEGSKAELSNETKQKPTETAVKKENLDFIKTKLEIIKKLKNAINCESRKISVSFTWNNRFEEYRGCMDGKDPMSQQLNELSAALMILL